MSTEYEVYNLNEIVDNKWEKFDHLILAVKKLRPGKAIVINVADYGGDDPRGIRMSVRDKLHSRAAFAGVRIHTKKLTPDLRAVWRNRDEV